MLDWRILSTTTAGCWTGGCRVPPLPFLYSLNTHSKKAFPKKTLIKARRENWVFPCHP